jgi:hypothetical protein
MVSAMKVELLVPAKKRRPGQPRKFQRIKRVSIEVAKPDSLEDALGNLLFLDARSLDRTTRDELLRVLPHLFQASRAWQVRFAEYGCLCCHKKRVTYGAGGLCGRCQVRELNRMREWYRKIGGDSKQQTEALTRKYDVAQMLLNGDE